MPTEKEKLEHSIKDAHEALMNAVALRDWMAVVKYARQLKESETALYFLPIEERITRKPQ